ncbi:MAG: hypothetical protein KatS3mg111_2329 [Pirellulaceae bacterium]|nr:MAG: hypothetical protein KatS3mg111_2329 [Pirellulaceae bacterium]
MCCTLCSRTVECKQPVFWSPSGYWVGALLGVLVGIAGCGQTKSFTATEQLLMSDAVDATVAQIDFTPLMGQRVYLDTSYLKSVKNNQLIDSSYVISALRQQMAGTGVLLVENPNEAEVIAEARLGALGIDDHTVTYGIPQTNALANASKAIGGQPFLPALPEISFARKEKKSGAAKVAVFAYRREDRAPIWQSGIALANSDARDLWILGMGPLQRGTIYEKTKFAGGDIDATDFVPALGDDDYDVRTSEAFAAYANPRIFIDPRQKTTTGGAPSGDDPAPAVRTASTVPANSSAQ